METYDIRDYGSLPGVPKKNRLAIQAAVDTAAAAGGGRVLIPAGIWATGSIELKSRVELHLEKGAVLVGSADASDYNADDVFPENFFSVGEEWSGGHLVYARNAHDIAITGEGTIDGNGGAFFGDCQYVWHFPGYKYGIKLFPRDRVWFRPGPMVAIFLSDKVRIEGVTLANSPCWTCHVRCCNGVTIKNARIEADRTIANSDGFSFDCTRNVEVDGCSIKTGDDGFAIRASCRFHAAEHVCENIVVRDCDVWSCCFGVRLGIGSGTIRNVSFEDCRFHESAWGVGFTPAWVGTERNVHIENTSFRRCFFGECERPVVTEMPNGDAAVDGALFEDCRMESLLPSRIDQTDEARVADMRFVRCSRKTLVDGVKVYQDRRWLRERQREIRSSVDLFAVGNAEIACVDCSPSPGMAAGVLLLSFDDRNFEDWVNALPLFGKYGAHATFFISGEMDNSALRAAKRLRSQGHSVGLHGLDHANAPESIEAKGAERYYKDEIAAPSARCYVSHLPVTSFAYPNCRRTVETDRLLYAKGFERVRGGVKGAAPYDPRGEMQGDRKPLATNEAVFFPVDELPTHRLVETVLMGESYHTDIDEILRCLRRIAERREVLSLTSHGISPDARGIDMKTEWLEKILATALELGIRVMGFDELPPPTP